MHKYRHLVYPTYAATQFKREFDRLSCGDMLASGMCGFLNIAGIITYFAAIKNMKSAVSFAIFLCAPVVSKAVKRGRAEQLIRLGYRPPTVGTVRSLIHGALRGGSPRTIRTPAAPSVLTHM